jgi:hypothetical protein
MIPDKATPAWLVKRIENSFTLTFRTRVAVVRLWNAGTTNCRHKPPHAFRVVEAYELCDDRC